MRLIYAMAATIAAAFIVLYLPIGCMDTRVMIANLLIAAVPCMIFIGVLRMQRDR